MMRFSTLIKNPADWMVGKGSESAVVVTSRVRLARNLKGFKFPSWLGEAEKEQVLGLIREETQSLPLMKNGFAKELSNLESLEKHLLVERHLISREQASKNSGSGVVIDKSQHVALMINEEDHLRMQSIWSGLQLRKSFETLLSIDKVLEKRLPFAFDKSLGYLTACPSNVGTGMRASAMLHLPALVISKQITKVLDAVAKIGLAVRGLYGEGTECLGHFFQISNQSTLGESESEIIERLERVILQVAQHEKNARAKMSEEEPHVLNDKIGRAYGILKHGHFFESKEAMEHLSVIRMAADLGCFSESMLESCDKIIMSIQPAHLQFQSEKILSAEERDVIRAEILRDWLQSFPAPANVNRVISSDEDENNESLDLENE